mmetsp:Transcript_14151/g.19583  ORF Transcript_14151/g.19583 Transcript_14151/m.19583 type:complete len:170 (+) Transcript_14151:295-804(+)
MFSVERIAITIPSVSVVENNEVNVMGPTSHIREAMWPVAATNWNTRSIVPLFEKASSCSVGEVDCCLKLVPNTKESMKLLKSVNYAFQSAPKFKIEASKIVSFFKEKTDQDVVVAMHWRLDGDFVRSTHSLSSQKYYKEMLNAIKFTEYLVVVEQEFIFSCLAFRILVK